MEDERAASQRKLSLRRDGDDDDALLLGRALPAPPAAGAAVGAAAAAAELAAEAAEPGSDGERSEEPENVNEVDGVEGDDHSESRGEEEEEAEEGGNGVGGGIGGWFYLSEDDTVDDDFDNAIYAESYREAAEHLEETLGGPIEKLCLIPRQDESENGEEEGQGNERVIRRDGGNDATSFRRFVAALGRPQGRGGRAVRELHLVDVAMTYVWEHDLARLFGEVLPAHRTLEVIGLSGREIPQPHVRLLVSSIRAGGRTPLRRLELECAIDCDTVRAVAAMIRRNVPLSELELRPLTGPDLEAEDCKLICQSVLANTNLRVLQLRLKAATADALDDVVAESSLRRLAVIADEWSDECVASVARQLRTNTTLESLHIVNPKDRDGHSRFFRPIAEVLGTYNFTLRKVKIRLGIPIPRQAEHELEDRVLTGLRRRNRRIRRAIEQHLEPRGYHVSPASLWPRALGTVSAVPTLVYRLLRNGDLNALCDRLLHRGPLRASRGTKRGRRPTARVTEDDVDMSTLAET